MAAFAARFQQKVEEFLGAKQATRAQAKGLAPAQGLGAERATASPDGPAVAQAQGSDTRA